MGLDLLNYTIALERTFGIAIPDADAANLKTARQVADYVAARLAPLGPDHCVSQQAFYRLRAAATRAFNLPDAMIVPDTRWSVLFGKRPRADWQILRRAVGSVEWPGFLWTADGPRTETVGETAEFLALEAAVAARRPGTPWSQREIEFIVRGLAVKELDIADIPWEAEFVRDLGCG